MKASRALLQSVNAVLRRDREFSLRGFVVFLSVCEREGIRIKELAYACDTSEASASRCVQTLSLPSSRRSSVRHHGLLCVIPCQDDRRSRRVFLTEDGRQLRSEIETILGSCGSR